MNKLLLILILLLLSACSPDYDASADLTGLKFDGIDDYILIEENVIPDSGDYTISVWIKADSGNTGLRIVLSQSDTSGSPFYFGSISNSDTSGTIKMPEDWVKLKNENFFRHLDLQVRILKTLVHQ